MSRRHDSENEDDPEPEPFQSSGDEWNLEEAKKEAGSRRKSVRISRKHQIPVFNDDTEDDTFSEGSSDEEAKMQKNRKKPVGRPPTKKRKISNDSDVSMDTSSNHSQEGNGFKKVDDDISTTDSDSSKTALNSPKGGSRKFIPKTIFSETFATGSFVILKKDAQGSDPSKRPCIWRIDGKALLQRYEAFEDDNKIRHKNTSVYTGWSPLDKDLYAPLTVVVVKHNNNNLTVEVQWEKLKINITDSD